MTWLSHKWHGPFINESWQVIHKWVVSALSLITSYMTWPIHKWVRSDKSFECSKKNAFRGELRRATNRLCQINTIIFWWMCFVAFWKYTNDLSPITLNAEAGRVFRSRDHSSTQSSECCSVLQCVAVCCSVLQCVAVCCSVLQCV